MDGVENASTGKADVAEDVIKSELSRTVAAGSPCPPNVKVTRPAFTTMMSSVLDQRSDDDHDDCDGDDGRKWGESDVLGDHDFWESKINIKGLPIMMYLEIY